MTGYQVGDGIRGTLVRGKGPDYRTCKACGKTIRQGSSGTYGHVIPVRSHSAQP